MNFDRDLILIILESKEKLKKKNKISIVHELFDRLLYLRNQRLEDCLMVINDEDSLESQKLIAIEHISKMKTGKDLLLKILEEDTGLKNPKIPVALKGRIERILNFQNHDEKIR